MIAYPRSSILSAYSSLLFYLRIRRLSDQAKNQLKTGGTKFEDLCLGEFRPSQLIKRYSNLYAESRVEAVETLDQLPEMAKSEELKAKLLLSIIVASFILLLCKL